MVLPDKNKNFSEWYERVTEEAEIIDKRYPVKGMLVWKPYGYKALKLTIGILEELLEEYGHQEAYFPMLVPEEVFAKEKDFLEGFSGETFVVERTISKKLTRRFLLRPTSETVMYYMFNLWITSYRDLPIKLYQTVNVFRYETEQTHPILRVREIIRFNEAHTVHATPEDAHRQVMEGIEIYSKFFDELRIPYLILKTPPWDTFAGAEYNFDFFALMPDKKAIELGSVINLGQKFAKAFDIKFQDKDGEWKYVYQTCYGVSERVVGVLIAVHGDNRGIIFPPKVAPIQIVIVPIPGEEIMEKILEKCRHIHDTLKDAGFRVHLDDRDDVTPGRKYYWWEFLGVPLRIEIGVREVEEGKVTIARRDLFKRVTVKDGELIDVVRKLFSEIADELYRRAKDWLSSNIFPAGSIEEGLRIYRSRGGGILKFPWCGDDTCGLRIEEETGLSSLGHNPWEEAGGKCVVCGKDAKHYFYVGKKY